MNIYVCGLFAKQTTYLSQIAETVLILVKHRDKITFYWTFFFFASLWNHAGVFHFWLISTVSANDMVSNENSWNILFIIERVSRHSNLLNVVGDWSLFGIEWFYEKFFIFGCVFSVDWSKDFKINLIDFRINGGDLVYIPCIDHGDFRIVDWEYSRYIFFVDIYHSNLFDLGAVDIDYLSIFILLYFRDILFRRKSVWFRRNVWSIHYVLNWNISAFHSYPKCQHSNISG